MKILKRIYSKLVKDDLDIAVDAMYKGCKTYKDWRRTGRQVRKGETCAGWVNGKAVFRKEQTDDVADTYLRSRRRPTGDKPTFREWREGNHGYTDRVCRDGTYETWDFPSH